MWAKYALYEALTSIPEYDRACPPNKHYDAIMIGHVPLHMYI